MTTPLQGISSMATRQVLAELATAWQAAGGEPVHIESVGGVDAARRVQAGEESFDVVFLAADAIAKLEAAGRVLPGSKVDLVLSSTAVAVRAGSPQPDIGSEEAVRAAVLAAPTVGYSTGPSGVALQKLFERWGIADEVKARTVQAPPGVPVGSLVARGEVALGFQQLSELIHVEGIAIVGALPPAIAIDTVFSAGVIAGSAQADAVRRLLAFMAAPEAAEAKRRQGMEPV
ncbi:substrate-binding domain-containing protein [Xenophilus arseniciresistens]|uniref:Substrate-binding domain-containing protein n=1 Tax=Xenophilus arseniciresistens TaxID=1283306 RepID=A0AAE3N4H0_9BURK|nr:substrate-binding domain-containing protein [Xenophilus arseniciresistens]MDA7415345.1 substrate-binding domain-containing protein [Xenophilus arseniciresistens]